MNNRAMQILNMALRSKPIMQNEIFSNAVNLAQNGRSKELWQLADNLCKSKGTTKEDVMKANGF